MSEFHIKFHGELPPDYEEVYSRVYGELDIMYDDLDGCPEDLIFHVVFLAKDHYGPTVLCWGDPDEPGIFHCEYQPTTEWVSVGDVDE
jgi:hypothetical protein